MSRDTFLEGISRLAGWLILIRFIIWFLDFWVYPDRLPPLDIIQFGSTNLFGFVLVQCVLHDTVMKKLLNSW